MSRALASIEQRFAQHNARVSRLVGAPSTGAGRRGGAGGASALLAQTKREQSAIQREQEKAAKAQSRILQKSEDLRRRELDRSFRTVERNNQREIKLVEAKARRQVKLERDFRNEREKAVKEFRRTTIGNGARRVMGGVAAVGKAGAAMLGVGGAALAASAVTDTLKLDEQVRRLVVSGRGQGQQGMDPDALRKKIVAQGMSSGIAPEQVASGLQAYVARTGDLTGGVAKMGVISTAAQAFGASTEDVANVAADLKDKFGIESVKELGDALGILSAQGKKGAFEIKNMAQEFPELGAAAKAVGLKGVEGMKTLGGLAQIARTSTGSGAEASTATQAMMTQLSANAGTLKTGEALGGKKVNVFQGGDATKGMRDLPTVLAEIISKSGGNETQMTKLFDIRGKKAVNPLISTFKSTRDKALAGGATAAAADKAGKQAILDQIKDASNAGGDFAEVQRDAADVQKSASIQLEIAMMQLKDVFAEELFPVVKELTPQIKELAPAVRTAIKSAISLGKAFAEHPWLGMGAIMAASLTSEITKANLAQVLSGKVVTPLGAFGSALGVASTALVALSLWLDKKTNEGKAKADAAAKGAEEINAKAQAEMDATGQLSPETRKQLLALQQTQNSTLEQAKGSGPGMLTTANAFFNPWADESTAAVEKDAALKAAAGTDNYTQSVINTRRLVGADEASQKYGPENFKAAEVGAAIGDAVIAKINAAPINRGTTPTVPAVK